MPRGEQTQAPRCKVCQANHWSYEGHKITVIEAKARIIEPAPYKDYLVDIVDGKATNVREVSPVKKKRGRPKRNALG